MNTYSFSKHYDDGDALFNWFIDGTSSAILTFIPLLDGTTGVTVYYPESFSDGLFDKWVVDAPVDSVVRDFKEHNQVRVLKTTDDGRHTLSFLKEQEVEEI